METARRHRVLDRVRTLQKEAGVLGAIGNFVGKHVRDPALRALGAPFRGAVRTAKNVALGKVQKSGPLAGKRQVMERRGRWTGRGSMPQWMADDISAGKMPGRVDGPVHDAEGKLLGYKGESPGKGGIVGLAGRHPVLTGALAYGMTPLPGAELVRSFATFPVDIAKNVVVPNTSLRPEVLAAFQKQVSFQNPLAASRANPRIPYREWGRRNVLPEPELSGPRSASPEGV
jgi:hypothetical protein